MKKPQIAYLLVFAFLAFLLSLRVTLTFFEHSTYVPTDFRTYWLTSERLTQGASLYVPSDSSPYKYSPAFAMLFRGSFFVLPQPLAIYLWSILSIALYLSGLALLVHRTLRDSKPTLFSIAVFSLSMALSWRGILETLAYGQIDLIVGGVFLVLSIGALRPSQRSYTQGIANALLWTFLLLVKPQLGLSFPAFAWILGLRFVIQVTGFTVLAYSIPFIVLGPSKGWNQLLEWIHCLQIQQTPAFIAGSLNQSLAATLARTFQSLESVGWMTTAGCFMHLGIFLVYVLQSINHRKRKQGAFSTEDRFILLGWGLGGYLLFSPLSWRWFNLFWPPLVLFLVSAGRGRVAAISWAILGVLSWGGLWRLLSIDTHDFVSLSGFQTWANLSLYLGFLWIILPRRSLAYRARQ